MDQIVEIIQTIMKGAQSPWKAALGSIMALFLYFFVMFQKGRFRSQKADSEKNDQKNESNIELENNNANSEASVRDRLGNRG